MSQNLEELRELNVENCQGVWIKVRAGQRTFPSTKPKAANPSLITFTASGVWARSEKGILSIATEPPENQQAWEFYDDPEAAWSDIPTVNVDYLNFNKPILPSLVIRNGENVGVKVDSAHDVGRLGVASMVIDRKVTLTNNITPLHTVRLHNIVVGTANMHLAGGTLDMDSVLSTNGARVAGHDLRVEAQNTFTAEGAELEMRLGNTCTEPCVQWAMDTPTSSIA